MKATRKIFYTTILVLLFVILIKLFLPAPFKNETLIDAFWISKTHLNANNNIVFGGDSRVYRGISCNAFLQEIPADLTAYNFGYSSAGYSEAYLNLLETKLDLTNKNKIIVLGISPHSLTPSALKNEGLIEYKNINWFDQFKGLYLSPYLKYFSPYKIDELVNSFKGVKPEQIYVEDYEIDGWVKSDKFPADSTEALASYQTVFNNNQVNNYIVQNLMHKIVEWNKKGISVVGFRPPTSMEMAKLEDSLSGFNEAKFKLDFSANGGHWIDVKNSDYVSYDGSHLNSISAEKFSHFLGKEIKLLMGL